MTSPATQTPVKFPSIVTDFGFSPLAPALWRRDSRTGLQYRTLTLDTASANVLSSHHYRAAGVVATTTELGRADAPFAFLFVLAGKLTMNAAGAPAVILGPLDSACRYGSGPQVSWTLSHDAQVMEIAASDAGAAALGFDKVRPGEWHVSVEDESAYALGEGPRRFFRYRDLGVAAATGRRIHIHVVRATQSVEGGTGWHSHTMGQIFYVLRGWADLAVQHRPWVKMTAGDAMCVAAGMAHDVPAFSPDYLVLEMCVPADYDTTDVPGVS